MTTDSSAESSNPQVADRVTESAEAAARTARQKAGDALDGLSNTMHRVQDQAGATLERLRPQLDSVTAYVKNEPTKALLIAAAVGAGVMGLIALIGRSRGTGTPPGRSLRRTASASAEDWRKAAADAGDNAASQAGSTIDTVKNAAQTAYDGLGETMREWKDQAAGLVDRVRPQLETVTNYTKDDPAKALLIAAAAGAALMGLISTIGR